MSRFHGPQQPGALRELRARRREQAEERQRLSGRYVMAYSDGCATFHDRDGEQFGGIGGTHEAESHVPWMKSRYSEEIVDSLMATDGAL